MDNRIFLSILTPTYNRSKELIMLFNSLQNQNNYNFEWIIVNDGSTDSTSKIVKEFINNAKFKIVYLEQVNSGKHIALNTGIKKCSGELTFIVDSDDYLVNDAISTILDDWEKYKSDSICGLSYLRGYTDTAHIGDLFTKDELKSNFISERINNDVGGDKAEVWKTKLLLETPFPSFENEIFLGEACVWIELARHYDMIFLNKILYICNYLDGGLTKSGRKLRIQCPVGGMYHASMFLYKDIKIKYRLKNAILYDCYGFFAKLSFKDILKNGNSKLLLFVCYLPSKLLYNKWKKYL